MIGHQVVLAGVCTKVIGSRRALAGIVNPEKKQEILHLVGVGPFGLRRLLLFYSFRRGWDRNLELFIHWVDGACLRSRGLVPGLCFQELASFRSRPGVFRGACPNTGSAYINRSLPQY